MFRRDGFAKFTNEVQHLVTVLSWEEVTDISVSKRDVRLPDYMPRDYRSRQIAASLDRSPSTVARELKRNGSRTQGYQPRYADQQAHARRWRGSKLGAGRGTAVQGPVPARAEVVTGAGVGTAGYGVGLYGHLP